MPHSAIVGGSSAGRLLHCPGSYQLNLTLPPAIEHVSDYADEGTAMHFVMADLMHARQVKNDLDLFALAESLEGRMFHDRALTRAHLDDMIWPALAQLARLEAEYGGGFEIAAVERTVAFPGIPGASGTADLLIKNAHTVLLADWKFGAGVPVPAVVSHGDSETVNPQLLFYLAASRHSLRHLFPGKRLVAAIIQPRAEPQLGHTVVTNKELRWFAEDLQRAVATAMERDPALARGEWCRWCPAKLICPKWTAPLLELVDLGDKIAPRTEMVTDKVDDYGLYLSRAKTLVDMAAQFKTTLDEQLHAYLEDGGVVPGWRLKAKEKKRQWVDDAIVDAALRDLGFEESQIWRRQLQTFASTDATAKRLGVEIPSHLREKPETTETTICQTDDPAPVVNKPLAIEAFREALAQLKKA